MAEGTVKLLEIGITGARLSVVASRWKPLAPRDDPWFDVEILVDAYPFTGTLQSIFALSELKAWAASMRSSAGLPQRILLGGDRAAELVIEVDQQVGGADGALALQIEVTPSGDDPYPFLRYLIFDASPFWAETSTNIDALT